MFPRKGGPGDCCLKESSIKWKWGVSAQERMYAGSVEGLYGYGMANASTANDIQNAGMFAGNTDKLAPINAQPQPQPSLSF
jgi:hypothetical protein